MHIFRRQLFSVLLTAAAFSLPFSATDKAMAYTLAFVSDFYGDGACDSRISSSSAAGKVAQLVRDGAPDLVIATEMNNCNGKDAEYNLINGVWNFVNRPNPWNPDPTPPVSPMFFAVPGNHDYYNNPSDATGFKNYFHRTNTYGAVTRMVGSTAWKIIGLDSHLAKQSATSRAEQKEFLKQELAYEREREDDKQCSLVFFHYPRWSNGEHWSTEEDGDNVPMNDFWTTMTESNVEVLLSGHDHNYERFFPKDVNGNQTDWDQGVVQVVAGTGGVKIRNTIGSSVPGSAVHFPVNSQDKNEYHGVLWVYLFETGYFAIFQSITGYAIDSWWSNCR